MKLRYSVFDSKYIEEVTENGFQIGMFMLDREYSFKTIIEVCIESRKSEIRRPVDIIATV